MDPSRPRATVTRTVAMGTPDRSNEPSAPLRAHFRRGSGFRERQRTAVPTLRATAGSRTDHRSGSLDSCVVPRTPDRSPGERMMPPTPAMAEGRVLDQPPAEERRTRHAASRALSGSPRRRARGAEARRSGRAGPCERKHLPAGAGPRCSSCRVRGMRARQVTSAGRRSRRRRSAWLRGPGEPVPGVVTAPPGAGRGGCPPGGTDRESGRPSCRSFRRTRAPRRRRRHGTMHAAVGCADRSRSPDDRKGLAWTDSIRHPWRR